MDRIKRVCKNYTDSGWYQSNILPEQFDTLEDWIKSKTYSAEETEKIKANREDMKELKLGGMDYNELKLQIEPGMVEKLNKLSFEKLKPHSNLIFFNLKSP